MAGSFLLEATGNKTSLPFPVSWDWLHSLAWSPFDGKKLTVGVKSDPASSDTNSSNLLPHLKAPYNCIGPIWINLILSATTISPCRVTESQVLGLLGKQQFFCRLWCGGKVFINASGSSCDFFLTTISFPKDKLHEFCFGWSGQNVRLSTILLEVYKMKPRQVTLFSQRCLWSIQDWNLCLLPTWCSCQHSGLGAVIPFVIPAVLFSHLTHKSLFPVHCSSSYLKWYFLIHANRLNFFVGE